MNILGINAFHGDASAALVKDGRWCRPSRRSGSTGASTVRGFPSLAIRAVLESRRRRRPARSITSRSRAIPRPTCTRRSSSRCRSGRRSPSWSRTASPTSPRCAASRTRSPRRSAWQRRRHARQAPQRRAPQVARLERLLRLGLRGGRLSVDRRLRRLRLDDARGRSRPRSRGPRSDRVSALGRAVLHGDHAVPRLSQVRRGVEDDGAGALRQAALRRAARAGDPPDRAAGASSSTCSTFGTTARASR